VYVYVYICEQFGFFTANDGVDNAHRRPAGLLLCDCRTDSTVRHPSGGGEVGSIHPPHTHTTRVTASRSAATHKRCGMRAASERKSPGRGLYAAESYPVGKTGSLASSYRILTARR
jgi:hypothetical protein